MYQLIIEKGGPINKRFRLLKNQMIIGRISECDIVIPYSNEISRRHAEICVRNDGCYITDLNSSNGTMINGIPLQPMQAYPIKVNDRIMIADEIRFRLATDAEYNLHFQQMVTAFQEGIENTSRIFSAQKILADFEGKSLHKAEKAEDVIFQAKNKINLLEILNRIEKELIAIRPINEYLDLVMDLVFNIIPADRGFLVLCDEITGELKSEKLKLRKAEVSETREWIHFSKTIIEKAIQDNVAILTPDAIIDDRFAEGESIFSLGIRSAMCVPLWTKDKIIGAIYVDTLTSRDCFDDDALVLLSAFANHAAIGIEQARLHETIIEQSKIRERLERYHSPEVVERIIQKDNSRIEAAECEVTILFADIVGFSTLIQQISPIEISSLLNGFYSMATEAIFRQGGTLDKFIGDNVMAIFGAPVPLKNNAERAVRCAVDIMERLIHFKKERPAEQQILLRIGINSGKVIAGDFGSTRRMEYSVLGEPVNTASRIQSQVAQPGQIVVGETTYKLTKALFEYIYLGKFKIRGKTSKINAYLISSSPEDPHIY